MIVELLLSPVFLLIMGVIQFLPTALAIPDWGIACFSLLSKALAFFPPDVWAIVIADIAFWCYVQLGWAIIEWVYRKIPGVS